MKQMITIALLLILTGSSLMAQPPGAVNRIIVKTVLASQGESYMDPKLSDLTKELQSVFRYSSYRIIAQSNMNLAIGQKGTASLPGERVLNITFMKKEGNRAELKLEIFKKSQSVFQSVVQLLDRGTMTVGGPQHEGGYLLFNISNSF